MRYDEKEKVWKSTDEPDRFYPDETAELVFDNIGSMPFGYLFSGWHNFSEVVHNIFDTIAGFLAGYSGVDKYFVDFPIKFMVGDLDEDGDRVGDDYELTPEIFDNNDEFLFDYVERDDNGVVIVYLYW